MKFRNILTTGAAALAIAVSAAPAMANPISGQITIGVGQPGYVNPGYYDNDRDYYDNDDRYDRQVNTQWNPFGLFGYNSNAYRGYNGYNAYNSASACGYNRVLLRMNNLQNHGGTIVLARTNGNYGLRQGDVLRGQRFYAGSRVCVGRRDLNMNRVSIIHDVNNNGVLDFRDGTGQISYGAGRGYGQSNVIPVNFRYYYGSRY